MLKLTERNYWQEIEATAFTPKVKDVLKGIINCYLHQTIPPQVTEQEVREMREGGPTEIHLFHSPERRWGGKILIVMHFVPESPKFREFFYLTRGYPNGQCVPLSQDNPAEAHVGS